MDTKKLLPQIKQVCDSYTNKFNIKRDDNWYVLKLQEEMGELIQSYLMMTGRARKKDQTEIKIKENFEKEVVDVLGFVLLLADFYNINLEKVIDEKWLKWNKQ